jgi:hypothetical protein
LKIFSTKKKPKLLPVLLLNNVNAKHYLLAFICFLSLLIKPINAEYLSDYSEEKVLTPPLLWSSAAWEARYLIGGIDSWLMLETVWRITSGQGVGLSGGLSANSEYNGGLSHFLFVGPHLLVALDEQFFYYGIHWFSQNQKIPTLGSGNSYSLTRIHAPLLRIGYGRNMLIWKNFPWGLKAELGLGYLLGESFSREREFVPGFKIQSLANMEVHFQIGLFRLWL